MLIQTVQSYLEMRRACGFALKSNGSLLCSFAIFSDAQGKTHVCADTAIEWAGLARLAPRRARRLGEVIRFAQYVRAEDSRHELPPPVFGKDNRIRPVPYIFSNDEIERLIHAAGQLGHQPTLRRDTYRTLFALLACTGLRVSEALNLRYEDITPDGMVIRCSKFRKSRLVPLHDSALAGLERYLKRRSPYAPFDDHVFISLSRKPVAIQDVERAFGAAVRKINLPRGPGMPRPTPHSLRHTFAVRSLEACQDDRDHITKHMLGLSTYLGHANVANTYWYLQATPELMTDISEVCERFVMGDRS
jgi:integrase/recombinase XerD